MSSEEEIDKSLSNDSESFRGSEKRSKITYSRDFLLSFSELDACKTLPSEFDSSLLSEFGDSHHGPQDRTRNPVSLPLQSHRRNDYSSSPPTRGVYGRWDNRPSVRSGRESDLQSDKDSVSDTGRAFGNRFPKPSQSLEHDGLLGSGTFARPPGFAAGSKGRSNDQYQLKKSNEPYQPPRPYKAGPLSRKEITDSLNDETFGSADCASHDQAEEERRRRESFELMRKEQQKSLQEKQKTTDKLKRDPTSDFKEIVGESALGNKKLDESVIQSVDSSKASQQASVSRPLVPPGFKSVVAEKKNTISIVHSRELEAEIPSVQTSEKSNERVPNLSTSMDILNGKYSVDNKLYKGSSLSEELKTQGVSEIVKSDTKKVATHDLIDPSKQAQNPSILDKLFGSVLSDSLFESSNLVKKEDSKDEDPWSQTDISQSSKFAPWFSKDEKKHTEDQTHARPNDLLSIIGGSEKGRSQASDSKLPQQISSGFSFPGSVVTELPKTLHKQSSKEETVPPILTCEDLEQTILSGYTENISTSKQSLLSHNVFIPKEPRLESDNQASNHLLSLLQKGPVTKDNFEGSIKENLFPGEKVETVAESGKSLTLETLFGSAFMKELQSAEAPVSALGSSNMLQSRSDNFKSLFGIYDSDSSKNRSDIELPEEESLIRVGESVFNPFGNSILGESQPQFSNQPMHGRHVSIDHEIPFQSRPPMNFVTQEGMIQRGGSMNHMVRPPFRYPNVGEGVFEPPNPILHQMQMGIQRPIPNNRPQLLQEYNRVGAPLPHHLRTRPGGPIQERSPMLGFPFEHQEPNFGGPGMSMQAPGVSGNHPEAFQKLLEMEMRANSSSKRIHPFGGSLGNTPQGGPHSSHDSESSFRYGL